MVDEKVDQNKANVILETERLQQQQVQQKKDDRDKKRKKIASTLSFGNDFEESDTKGYLLLIVKIHFLSQTFLFCRFFS